MQNNIQNITKFIVTFWTLWVLLFGFSQVNMGMGIMNGNTNCFLGGHSMAICEMNPMEHIEEWQSIFTTLPAKDAMSIFSVILIILALLAFRFVDKFYVFNTPRLEPYLNNFYLSKIPIFNPLKEAFSRGILNPKIF